MHPVDYLWARTISKLFLFQSLVILGDSFPHLPCTKANDGIEIRVVVWRPMKYLYAEGALFQVVFVSRESLFHVYGSNCG